MVVSISKWYLLSLNGEYGIEDVPWMGHMRRYVPVLIGLTYETFRLALKFQYMTLYSRKFPILYQTYALCSRNFPCCASSISPYSQWFGILLYGTIVNNDWSMVGCMMDSCSLRFDISILLLFVSISYKKWKDLMS